MYIDMYVENKIKYTHNNVYYFIYLCIKSYNLYTRVQYKHTCHTCMLMRWLIHTTILYNMLLSNRILGRTHYLCGRGLFSRQEVMSRIFFSKNSPKIFPKKFNHTLIFILKSHRPPPRIKPFTMLGAGVESTPYLRFLIVKNVFLIFYYSFRDNS